MPDNDIYSRLGIPNPNNQLSQPVANDNGSILARLGIPENVEQPSNNITQPVSNLGNDIPVDTGNWMMDYHANPIENLGAGLARIGTGIMSGIPVVTRALNPVAPIDEKVQIGKALASSTGEYLKQQAQDPNVYAARRIFGENPVTRGLDYGLQMQIAPSDLLTGTYGLDTRNVGELTRGNVSLGDFVGNVGRHLNYNIANAALDTLSLGGGSVVTKALKPLAKSIETSQKVLGTEAKAAQRLSETVDKYEGLAQYSTDELAELIRGAEEVGISNVKIPQKLKEAGKAFSEAFHKAVPENLREDLTEFVINTKMLRDAQKLEPNVNLSQSVIAQMNEPYYQILRDGDINKLIDLAREGDNRAEKILEIKTLYDKGELFPITHGLAEVNKEALVARGDNDFAGRFSKRVFGNASYKDIAKELLRPEEYIDDLTYQYAKADLARSILNGEFSDSMLIRSVKNLDDVYYIPKSLLEEGQLKKALNSASKGSPLEVDSVAVDSNTYRSLKNLISTMGGANPFGKGFLADLYTTAKRNILASGAYLVGNLQTGLFNLLMDHNFNPVTIMQDLKSSIKSKGRLTRNLGLYRTLKPTKSRVQNPVLKAINAINAPVSDSLAAIDAKMQNTFAEAAAHARMRTRGIQESRRLKELLDTDKEELARLSKEVGLTALINPSRTILPTQLHGVAGLTQPFWRWTDTAAQSSYEMLKKHPIVMNLMLARQLKDIGLDYEMANRENLEVDSDKPFVKYRYNPFTQTVEEVSSEMVPLLNTLKFTSNAASLLSGNRAGQVKVTDLIGSNSPFVSALYSSLTGKDKYGRAMRRSHETLEDAIAINNNERYKFDGTTGQWKQIGGQADEIFATTIRELLAYPQIFNRIIGPSLATGASMLTGQDVRYYRPYGQGILGGTNPEAIGNILSAPNPISMTTPLTVGDFLSGQYASPYFEERDYTSRGQSRRMFGNAIRRDIREQENIGQ